MISISSWVRLVVTVGAAPVGAFPVAPIMTTFAVGAAAVVGALAVMTVGAAPVVTVGATAVVAPPEV